MTQIRDYEAEKQWAEIPGQLRLTWLVTACDMYAAKRSKRQVCEALFNAIRPRPPLTWRSGVQVFQIHADDIFEIHESDETTL